MALAIPRLPDGSIFHLKPMPKQLTVPNLPKSELSRIWLTRLPRKLSKAIDADGLEDTVPRSPVFTRKPDDWPTDSEVARSTKSLLPGGPPVFTRPEEPRPSTSTSSAVEANCTSPTSGSGPTSQVEPFHFTLPRVFDLEDQPTAVFSPMGNMSRRSRKDVEDDESTMKPRDGRNSIRFASPSKSSPPPRVNWLTTPTCNPQPQLSIASDDSESSSSESEPPSNHQPQAVIDSDSESSSDDERPFWAGWPQRKHGSIPFASTTVRSPPPRVSWLCDLGPPAQEKEDSSADEESPPLSQRSLKRKYPFTEPPFPRRIGIRVAPIVPPRSPPLPWPPRGSWFSLCDVQPPLKQFDVPEHFSELFLPFWLSFEGRIQAIRYSTYFPAVSYLSLGSPETFVMSSHYKSPQAPKKEKSRHHPCVERGKIYLVEEEYFGDDEEEG